MRAAADFFRIIYLNKRALTGTVILLIFILMAIFGAWLVKVDMTVQFEERYQSPSWEHWLGTDYAGRDTFKQLIVGSRDVLSIGVYSALFAIFIGFVVGAVSGFSGKWVDTLLMLITNLFLTIPSLPVLMIISAIVTIKSNIAFAAIVSLVSWAGLARAVRSQILSLKERDFIVVCKLMGLKLHYIIFKEMMPNMISYIAISFIGIMQTAILSSVGLMLLGLAPFSPTNWGMMIQLAYTQTGGLFNPDGYYYLFSPIICLALFQMGCIFFANGLDDALNPRLRSSK